jgi:hypothetical protein
MTVPFLSSFAGLEKSAEIQGLPIDSCVLAETEKTSTWHLLKRGTPNVDHADLK